MTASKNYRRVALALPSESVLPGEKPAAVIALVIARLLMDAAVVPLQICFAYKSLVAVRHRTRKRILTMRVMSVQVGFVVVAPAEEFATSLNFALIVCIILSREAPCPAFATRWPITLCEVLRKGLLLVGLEGGWCIVRLRLTFWLRPSRNLRRRDVGGRLRRVRTAAFWRIAHLAGRLMISIIPRVVGPSRLQH